MTYSRCWKYLPERIKLYLNHPDWGEQSRRLNQLIGLLATNDMLGLNENFYEIVHTSDHQDVYDINWQKYDAFLPHSEEVVSQ